MTELSYSEGAAGSPWTFHISGSFLSLFSLTFHALHPAPVSWLWSMLSPQPKIDAGGQRWSRRWIIEVVSASVAIGSLPVWPNLVISSVILHADITASATNFYVRHWNNYQQNIYPAWPAVPREQFISRMCGGAAAAQRANQKWGSYNELLCRAASGRRPKTTHCDQL